MKQHRVYQELRRAIYTGQIKPGEKLVERRLAQEFDTSRGPLRESLLRLMSEGLVCRNPRRTSYVNELTVSDIRDIYFIRMTLEPAAARLAAQRPLKSLIRNLIKLVDRMTAQMTKGNNIASAVADFEFHREIVEASQSERLIRAYELSHVPMLISQLSLQWRKPDALRAIHLEIVNHIQAGAADEAEASLLRHIQGAARRYDTT